ncbi:hypothetical protein CJU72_12330 [Pseudomonas fragi]|nr:hypothetical protein CJU72_12330 [Pseudomonas fragi]
MAIQITEFIDGRGHLIEVIQHETVIKVPCYGGPIMQPRINTEHRDRGEATVQDRLRILQEFNEQA